MHLMVRRCVYVLEKYTFAQMDFIIDTKGVLESGSCFQPVLLLEPPALLAVRFIPSSIPHGTASDTRSTLGHPFP